MPDLSSKLGSKLTVLNILEVLPVVYVQSQIIVDSVINVLEDESKKFLKGLMKNRENLM